MGLQILLRGVKIVSIMRVSIMGLTVKSVYSCIRSFVNILCVGWGDNVMGKGSGCVHSYSSLYIFSTFVLSYTCTIILFSPHTHHVASNLTTEKKTRELKPYIIKLCSIKNISIHTESHGSVSRIL